MEFMLGDYGPNNIQTAAAKRPTNQTTESRNNQSSRVMRLKGSRSWRAKEMRYRQFRCRRIARRGYSGILPTRSC
jgi:hypothetical protein